MDENIEITLYTDYIHGANIYQSIKLRYFMLLRKPINREYVYYTDENNYATLVYYIGRRRDVKVPTRIGDNNEYIVKHIAPTCFCFNKNIRSVKIPEGVETIG
jgi:hypothetical protein